MTQTAPFSRPAIIINASAGSTSDITADIKQRFETAGVTAVFDAYVEAQELGEAFTSAMAANPDLLIIYGGDGTALSGAKTANAKDIPILPLPGGTMNMLHKSYYGTSEWEEVLEVALTKSEPHWRPAGFVGEHMFLVAAIIGQASRFALSREAIREGEITEAVKEAVATISDVEPSDTFHYSIEDTKSEPTQANLLLVTCPQMNEFAKRRDAFEVASVDADKYSDVISLGLSAIRSNWRDDSVAETKSGDKVFLTGKGELDCLTDGDHVILSLPIIITFEPKGIKVLAPPPA